MPFFTMRLAVILALVIANAIYEPSVFTNPLGLGLTIAAPLYAGVVLLIGVKVQSAWVSWLSCALDVLLISATLWLFVAMGEPLGALNNRFLVEAYAFVVINATLRFDWRLCAFTSVLALGSFLGITAYVAHHWDLASITSRNFGSFDPLSHGGSQARRVLPDADLQRPLGGEEGGQACCRPGPRRSQVSL